MRRLGLHFLGCVAVLGGCGAEAPTSKEQVSVYANDPAPVTRPDFGIVSNLWLLADGRRAQVGTLLQEAEKLFPKPERRAIAFRDLPPGFGPGYRSSGWETDVEGYGIISVEGKVVVAVHQIMGADEDRVDEVLLKYRRGLDPRFVSAFDPRNPHPQGVWARYWFAEENNHRLMVSAVRTGGGEVHITEAIGSAEAMSALRMGPREAENDLAKLKSK
jgi:hypothetical protein